MGAVKGGAPSPHRAPAEGGQQGFLHSDLSLPKCGDAGASPPLPSQIPLPPLPFPWLGWLPVWSRGGRQRKEWLGTFSGCLGHAHHPQEPRRPGGLETLAPDQAVSSPSPSPSIHPFGAAHPALARGLLASCIHTPALVQLPVCLCGSAGPRGCPCPCLGKDGPSHCA